MSDVTPPDPDASQSLQAERDARIAELEARARLPRGTGVSPAVAAMGIVLCGFLLWQQRLDVAYLLAPREPITLGSEGHYRLEQLTPNRYVQVHGRPTSRASFGQRDGETVVMVGLEGTPLVVRRGPLPGEAWEPGRPPPSPHPAPFAVRGRLLREDQDPAFAQGFESLRSSPQLRPLDGRLWVIVESERPGADRAAAGWLVVIGALLLFNVWLLMKGLSARARRLRMERSD